MFDTCQNAQNQKWLTSCLAELMDMIVKIVCLKKTCMPTKFGICI